MIDVFATDAKSKILRTLHDAHPLGHAKLISDFELKRRRLGFSYQPSNFEHQQRIVGLVLRHLLIGSLPLVAAGKSAAATPDLVREGRALDTPTGRVELVIPLISNVGIGCGLDIGFMVSLLGLK